MDFKDSLVLLVSGFFFLSSGILLFYLTKCDLDTLSVNRPQPT